MNFLHLKESDLKKNTLLLIDNQVIFHPSISPNGIPDFTNYLGKNFILIIDRNILTQLILLLKKGQLKNDFSRKIISSLMFWAQINNIAITSGLALSEYASTKQSNDDASFENNMFKTAFDYYDMKIWLDLALERRKTIPILELNNQIEYDFYKEYDHYKMHYLELIKMAQLFFNKSITLEEKFKLFHTWNYENILICKYTTIYFALLLGGRINTFKKIGCDFNKLIEKCKNQAWDLSYLSLWSTFYYFENEGDDIYLFATLDKDLKLIFKETHKEQIDVYQKLFGRRLGKQISENISQVYKERIKPEINDSQLVELIKLESNNLSVLIESMRNGM